MPTTKPKGMGETIMKTVNCPGQGDVYRMEDRRRNLRAIVRINKVLPYIGVANWRVSAQMIEVPNEYVPDNFTILYPQLVSNFEVWEKVNPNVWDKAKKLSEEYRIAMISLYKESEKNSYL